jgi:thiol-disulfide isomerase/thioredoxin
MARRRTFLTTVVATALLTTGCTRGPTSSPVSVPPTPARNATEAPLLPTTVNELPATDVAGFHELLDQLKGTPVIVNIWGSWCEPCKSEAPMLTAAALAHPDIQFVGVDILDSRNGALGFLTTYDVPYPSLFDPPGDIKTDLGSLGQPDTYFYDANGTQVAKVIGVLSQTTLDAALARIVPA